MNDSDNTEEFVSCFNQSNQTTKMAIGVDTSKWKPRNLRGTPAFKFSNYLGYGLVSVGVLCGIYFHFSNFTTGIKKASEALYEDPIEEVERRMMIASGLPNRSGDTLRKLLREDSRPDRPHK